ncbi:integrase_H2C2 domain-containing protein [Trichonephila clavipes]|nr:integrase_H2C2 domain-containing protein [Trichonephila clavipes]
MGYQRIPAVHIRKTLYCCNRPSFLVLAHESKGSFSGRLARWALRLQERDFDVKYKTGKKHSDADALSRNPEEEETETPDKFLAVTTSTNLAMEQKKDPHLAKLKLSSNSSKNEEFRFIDGILCRKNFDPDGKLWLPVILKHLRADRLRHFHDAPTAGHLGFTKTYDRIRKRFYRPECNEMSFGMSCIVGSAKGENPFLNDHLDV